MDRRQEIIGSIIRFASRGGYTTICADESLSYTFDLILRNESRMMVIKVMNNVGLLTEETSKSLIAISRFLDAHPLIIGMSNRDERIEDGVVYSRYSLPIISPQTLVSYLKEGEEPTVRAGPGGFYVEIDSEKLKRIREQRSLSLGEIASAIGTTRRTVLMYQSGMSASIDIALKMEEFLGEEIMEYVSFLWSVQREELTAGFRKMREFERLVNQEITRKGFVIYPIRRSIVNFLMEDSDSSYLGGIEEEVARVERKIEYLSELSEMSNKEGLLVVKREIEKPKRYKIPVISYSELEKLHDKDELKGVIRERRNS
ncbi:MAG: helix-turn-helix domain-containing protein [Candidatus Thermoplasmatota archaeon]|jgi:putative transcriptional regulator|nr:helix-turn-helix domain-containing protein [Candidatus Thermoplasmatota archaeon]MCL6002193.1 helix-turn-helix domain-containing protein [Candidatus Thermoplasmatota archaeon]